jgi:N-acetyl-anhydromuramyl-L-alanine amidase AmpD
VISAIVLHATADEGNEAGAIEETTNPATQKSYHVIVGRDGTITVEVTPDRRAWHAGVSALDGVHDVNNFSIGLAFANKDDGVEPYPSAQLEAAAQLCNIWRESFPAITLPRIVTHAAVALPPGRKDDPRGLDVPAFRSLVEGLSNV